MWCSLTADRWQLPTTTRPDSRPRCFFLPVYAAPMLTTVSTLGQLSEYHRSANAHHVSTIMRITYAYEE